MLQKLAAAAALTTALSSVAFAMPMAGSLIGHVDSQDVQPMGAPGDMRITKTASGTNAGPGTPLDGARVQWSDVTVLKGGQGPVMGTITFITPTGTTSSPYKGTVTTDPMGRVMATGTFRTIKGSGDFAGLKGRGTFSVAFSSPTDFTGQWQGDFKTPGQRTSRR